MFLSPLDLIVLTNGQARIVSRIALSLASDGGSASRAAIETGPCRKCRKTRRFGI